MNGANHQQQLNLTAGFRFHPTDDELVVHYLCRKCAGQNISVPIITEIDLYKFDPLGPSWNELKRINFHFYNKPMVLYGEKEWYFSPRDRKYPNCSRPNRTAGIDIGRPVGKPKTLGIKKAMVFYPGDYWFAVKCK